MATIRRRGSGVQDDERTAVRKLYALLRAEPEAEVQVVSANGTTASVPASVRGLLERLVHDLAEGKAVAVLPLDDELTTQEAAGLLNVSRPFLIKLLEAGEIPFTHVGAHRRVRVEDVLRYRDSSDRRSRHLLDLLARTSQQMGLYD